jgi:hypothetical protein
MTKRTADKPTLPIGYRILLVAIGLILVLLLVASILGLRAY